MVFKLSNVVLSQNQLWWSGDDNGTDVVDGLYIYTLQIELEDGQSKSLFGEISVFR